MNTIKGTRPIWTLPPLLLLALSSCETLEPEHSSIPIEDLRSAPQKVLIDGRELVLETYLWRDFQPISPPDGQPLVGILRITATDSQRFPASLGAAKAFLLKGDSVWEAGFSDEPRTPDPQRLHQLEKVFRGGPKWGPHIYVDVVVLLFDRANRTYLLRASKQWINRTD